MSNTNTFDPAHFDAWWHANTYRYLDECLAIYKSETGRNFDETVEEAGHLYLAWLHETDCEVTQ